MNRFEISLASGTTRQYKNPVREANMTKFFTSAPKTRECPLPPTSLAFSPNIKIQSIWPMFRHVCQQVQGLILCDEAFPIGFRPGNPVTEGLYTPSAWPTRFYFRFVHLLPRSIDHVSVKNI